MSRGLLGTFLFGGRRDRILDEGMMIPYTSIAKLAGKQRQAAARNFRALDHLLNFKEQFHGYGVPVSWAAPNYHRRRCRVLFIDLPAEVLRAAKKEMENPPALSDRVFWMTGLPWTRKRASQLAAEERAEEGELPIQMTMETQRVVDYHNHLPPQAFSALVPRARELLKRAAALEDAAARERITSQLRAFMDHPQPHYKGVARSARAYPEGMSLNTLKKEYRHLLLPWVEFDLVNTQLACVARDWDCAPLLAFLGGGGNFWAEIMEACGEGSIKPAIKPAVYGLCFGQRRTRCEASLLEALKGLDIPAGRRRRIAVTFFEHPLIQALLAARAQREAKIKAEGQARTCLGEVIRVTSHRPAHAVNAACAQAMELALLAPLYDMALTTTDFTIMLYLYDGVSVKFTRRREYWEGEMGRAVERKAREMGIPTRLQVAHDPQRPPREAKGRTGDPIDKDRNHADLLMGEIPVGHEVSRTVLGRCATLPREGGYNNTCVEVCSLTELKGPSNNEPPGPTPASRSKKVGNPITKKVLTEEDFHRVNLPQEFWGARSDQVPETVRAGVIRYLSHLPDMRKEGAGLFLLGDPGVGKTCIGALVVKQGRSIGMTCYFARISDLREDIRQRAQFDGDQSMFHRCREVDILVLDDLAPSDAKDTMWFGVRQIEELVAARKSARRITVLTTRMTGDSMRQDPTLRSLVETAKGALVPMRVSGPNLHEIRLKGIRRMLGVRDGQ